jgi:predicted ribosome quality control (RQC) complex YloA/Tae2 family protein
MKKMPMDAPAVAQISIELNRYLPVRIDHIFQPFTDEFILCGYGSGTDFKLFISLNAGYGRFHLLETIPKENLPAPTIFLASLKRHFSGAKLTAVAAVPFERIVKFTFEAYEPGSGIINKFLQMELTGKSSNLIVCDENLLIIDAWRRVVPDKPEEREIAPGVKYELPATGGRWRPVSVTLEQFKAVFSQLPAEAMMDKFLLKHWYGLSALSVNEITHNAGLTPTTLRKDVPETDCLKLFNSFSAWAETVAAAKFEPTIICDGSGKAIDCSALAIHYPPGNTITKPALELQREVAAIMHQRHTAGRFSETKLNLLKKINAQTEKARCKLAKQEAEAAAAEKGEQMRIAGELLTTYGFQIPKGSSQAKLINHYDPDGKELQIALNPALTPHANAQIYFKKYQKAKKGQLAIAEQIAKTQETLDYLESIETMAHNALNALDLRLVQEELEQNEIAKKTKFQPQKKFAKKEKPVEPRQFKTPAGHTLWVGRNNFQNDRLTFKIADSTDWWFHTQKIPGSHVILRPASGVPVDDESLNYACQLAVYFSKAKQSTKVPVDYTQRKYVKKPPAAKPGFVIYDFFKTAIITPDAGLLEKLGMPKDS